MPIYEYYCEACDGIFELLRVRREAGRPQPCPVCDSDSRALMPTEVQAFTFRGGLPRRLPDRGQFWHYDKVVSSPIDGPAVPGEHPELRKQKLGPERPPSTEEVERFAHRVSERMETEAESLASGRPPVRDLRGEHATRAFLQRRARTAPEAALQKRRDPNAKTTPRTRSGTHRESRGAEG